MLLSARPLDNLVDVNNFSVTGQIRFNEGDAPSLYLMLLDASKDPSSQGFSPAGRRYVPDTGATLQITLDSIDDSKKITRVATQPFPGDLSIWSIDLMPTDTVRGTINLKLVLTQGVKVSYGFVQAAICVSAGSNLDSSMGWRGGTVQGIF